MQIYIDTCVLPRCRLEEGRLYRERFGEQLGFELLLMFDIPDFEANLKQNRAMLEAGPLIFHEPVWGVEHTAARGSMAWEESQFHLQKTAEWAKRLHPLYMVYHLNNCAVPAHRKDRMLQRTLENLEETRELFPGTELLVENTGIAADGNRMLDQEEFTALCRERDFRVLIDVGHANANGWDIPKMIRELKDSVRGYHLHNNDGRYDLHRRLRDGTLKMDRLIPLLRQETPEAFLVVEYTREEYHGEPLCRDLQLLRDKLGKGGTEGCGASGKSSGIYL